MHKKLGIIAGGGAIPQDLINFCKENKRDYFVIAIEGNADKALIDDSIPHAWIRIGQAGTGFKKLAEEKGLLFAAPPLKWCTDNGAMIAWAGLERFAKGLSDGLDFKPRPRWPLDETAPKAAGAGGGKA